MERLTFRTELGVSIDKEEDCPTCSICCNCDIPPRKCKYISDALEKLADYEDLEEQGRLLKLPCKVGDTIYAVGEIVKEYKVLSVSYHSNKPTNRSEVCIETLPVNGSRVVVAFYDKEFGKNVFLTKSEAEAKLKELRGGKNE